MLVPRYLVVRVCVCVRPVQLDDSHTSNSVSGAAVWLLVGVREDPRGAETDDLVGVVGSALLSRAVPYSSVMEPAERSVADRYSVEGVLGRGRAPRIAEDRISPEALEDDGELASVPNNNGWRDVRLDLVTSLNVP